MKTADAVRFAEGKANLARLLGITRSAVTQWGDEMPPLQVYRLRELKPHWFAKLRREQKRARVEAL